MTRAELITLRGSLEAAILSGAGVSVVQVGDQQISYTYLRAKQALAEVNRSLAAYDRRAAGINPHWSKARWQR